MTFNSNPTLRKVLRELQALRGRIDQQIRVMERLIRPTPTRKSRPQKKAKKVKRPALVGFARDRQTLLRRKSLRKIR